jgi:pilus assembly protein CpaF
MSFELLRPFLRPIEELLLDHDVSEIMGNPNGTWYVEREGEMLRLPDVSFDPASLRTGLEVIANNLGKRLDEDNPVVEARLPEGSRLCGYIPPAVQPWPGLTIRKFTGRRFRIDDLIARSTLTQQLAYFLWDQVRAGRTLLISGGTGTGKTTLLNALAQYIPEDERIVTIEDTAELLIDKPNIVGFECQNDTFKKALSIEQLLRTALRCRPDRIIVGEVRGTEARTLLDSLNTGHSGSLATIHANSAAKALRRFANLVLHSHPQLSYADVEAEIADGVDYVVHVERQPGRRAIREVLRVDDYDRHTQRFQMEYVFRTETPAAAEVIPC